MMYPEDSLQSLIHPDTWWIKNEKMKICRGALIFSFIPYIDQQPYTFTPIGRRDPRSHDTAEVEVSPLKVNQPLRQNNLPVAAMPLNQSEVWAAYRAKKRPCLVFSSESILVEKELIRGKPKHATAPTFLAAPYYGVSKGDMRAGYSSQFIERVRHCEYCQFAWDILPFPGGEESILRLDHLQPIGAHYSSYKLSDYMLSDEAMNLLDELLNWQIWGGLYPDSMIFDYRKLIESEFK